MFDCTECGACCMEAPLEVNTPHVRARCRHLVGELNCNVSCAIYETRPVICREFTVGSPECVLARNWYLGISNENQV